MMDEKTKKGLEYLLETFPSSISVIDAISKYYEDYQTSSNK